MQSQSRNQEELPGPKQGPAEGVEAGPVEPIQTEHGGGVDSEGREAGDWEEHQTQKL